LYLLESYYLELLPTLTEDLKSLKNLIMYRILKKLDSESTVKLTDDLTLAYRRIRYKVIDDPEYSVLVEKLSELDSEINLYSSKTWAFETS